MPVIEAPLPLAEKAGSANFRGCPMRFSNEGRSIHAAIPRLATFSLARRHLRADPSAYENLHFGLTG
jgi:hypothetical protein